MIVSAAPGVADDLISLVAEGGLEPPTLGL